MQIDETQTEEFWQGLRSLICESITAFCGDSRRNEIKAQLPRPDCEEKLSGICDALCGGGTLPGLFPGFRNLGEGHGLLTRIIDVIANLGKEKWGGDHQAPIDAIQHVINDQLAGWDAPPPCQDGTNFVEEALEIESAARTAGGWTYNPVVLNEQEWDWGFLDDADLWLTALALQAALAGAGYFAFRGPTADLRDPN